MIDILDKIKGLFPAELINTIYEDILWGMDSETSFGKAIEAGFLSLVEACDHKQLYEYHMMIRKYGYKGPSLGKLIAENLVYVLKLNKPDILDGFKNTIDTMLNKGTYTLYDPLRVIVNLCLSKEEKSVSAYLDLLKETFKKDLTYRQCQNLSYSLPRAVNNFSPSKRIFQIKELTRIIKEDHELTDEFLRGIANGLAFLSKEALETFVSQALEKYKKNKKLGAKFLSLESRLGLDAFYEMQVSVPISQVQHLINQYVKARTGLGIYVRPISSLSINLSRLVDADVMVFSDGRAVYLPDEIDMFENRAKNINLYKCLARLEAGLFEFKTFDFDLEKLSLLSGFSPVSTEMKNNPDLSDLEIFFSCFENRGLALDLFTIFEHGRLNFLFNNNYPGLLPRILPVLQNESLNKANSPANPLWVLYKMLALGFDNIKPPELCEEEYLFLNKTIDLFLLKIPADPVVETSAEICAHAYKDIENLLVRRAVLNKTNRFYEPINFPFRMQIKPEIYFSALRNFDKTAKNIKVKLEEKGIRAYRSDIRKKINNNNGYLSTEDIREIVLHAINNRYESQKENKNSIELNAQLDLSDLDLSVIMESLGTALPAVEDFTGPVFWYKEWDCRLGDYLNNHTRIIERSIPEIENDFYKKTLNRYIGLIRQIKYAFELIKPEGLSILRRWVEGDEFDFPALLDFAIDKKAGIMPSDKLYIKRIKQLRDVSVLLLVDLSRSTSNRVSGFGSTVLDLEKEAIVLFCEALQIIGDSYSIAGFSGTGRLGVDYYLIKDFEEELNEKIRMRINSMAPQRSTRMGAAIRHATARLEKIQSKVRLMIILGDGFPNDVDYKKIYAIEDTRKAISEARSKNIHAHALTVNIAQDPKLDELYGNVHHNVISDVRELPDKLWRIYRVLTRQ